VLELFIELWMVISRTASCRLSHPAGGVGCESWDARTGCVVHRCSPIWKGTYWFPGW